MKNEIDLSKIAVKETPKKVIKANFDGTERDYEIRALNDGEISNLMGLGSAAQNIFRSRNLHVCLLTCGLGINPEVADFLFSNVNAEAVRVADEIFALSNVFEKEKVEEAKEAEKNSKKGAAQPE